MILVTGANGFVGRNLVNSLIQDHPISDITIAIRQNNNLLPNVKTHIINDISPLTDWSLPLVGVKTVIHCAARVHIMKDLSDNPLSEFRKTNVECTLNLAQTAAKMGIKRFIFISSVKVNGEYTFPNNIFSENQTPKPFDSYAISKMEAELRLQELATQTGMEIVIIRPPLVYGPGVKANFAALIRAIQRGIPLPLGSIQNQRSLVSLDNLIDLIKICITHPKAANQTFLVSDGNDLSTPDLIRGIADAAGVPARLFPIPTWALQMSGNLLGKGDAVQRLCGNLQVNISKARNLLDWTPPISVEEGLKRALGNVEK
jgi:nucleoside-diphosphate-sugar epimerase